MADISKIKTTAGTTYDIKDETARSGLSDKVNKSGDTMTGDLTAPDLIVKGSASGVVPAIMGRNNNGSSLGTIDFLTTGQIQFRSYVIGVGSENYKLPAPTSAGTEYSIVTTKGLIPWQSTTTWTTAVAGAKMDIKVVFEYTVNSNVNIFTIDIPVIELSTSARWFYGTTYEKAGSTDLVTYYQCKARTTQIEYADLYRNGSYVSSSVRFLYR